MDLELIIIIIIIIIIWLFTQEHRAGWTLMYRVWSFYRNIDN